MKEVEVVAGFNGLTELDIHLNKPMKLQTEMGEFRSFNIMTGPNGTGKSFINKLLWAGSLMLNIKIILNIHKAPQSKTDEEEFQYIIDHTYDDHEMDGSFTLRGIFGEHVITLAVIAEEGKIVSVNAIFPSDMKPFQCSYLPTSTRLFSNLDTYLKLKKTLGIKGIPEVQADIDKLLGIFKLYEFTAFEEVIYKLKNIGSVWLQFEKILKDFISADGMTNGSNLAEIDSIEYDEDAAEVYYHHKDGSKKKIITLGNGEQSLIMMFLAAC